MRVGAVPHGVECAVVNAQQRFPPGRRAGVEGRDRPRGRRAAGLRREYLADPAGVSVDYIVRLEQGRAATPSASVVASPARALHLSTAEWDHLYRLAHLVPPADGSISDHLPPGVQRVLARLGDVAVAVFAAVCRSMFPMISITRPCQARSGQSFQSGIRPRP